MFAESADARMKRLLASGLRACARARMHRLNWNLRKETQRGGAAGLRGRSRAVCRAGAHASALGRWRTEPEVSTRALLGSAGGEVAASGHKRLSIGTSKVSFSCIALLHDDFFITSSRTDF